MVKKCLNALAIIAIEYDILEINDFQDILKEFTSKKLRKVNVL